MAQSTVKLIVDAQNAIRPLQRVNEQTKALSKSTDKLKGKLDKSNKSIRDTGKAAKTASSGVGTLVGALKPLLAALAVIGTAKFVFFKTAELETQRKSLEVLTDSVEDTNKIIKELQEFGAVTPFTSSELIEQTKRLKAFGFETEELVDTTKRLSEVAGATGADLTGIATAFGQIRAKGKLQQEENLQLLERGVDITTELKRITGLQGEAFEKAQRQGKIGADLVNQALINLTNEGGAFFGGATAQAETLNGLLSTLQDSFETLARTIGTELKDEVKGVLKLLISGVKQVNQLIERVTTANKVGRANLAKITMEARREARKQLREEKGFFANLSKAGREREKQLFEQIKAKKVQKALDEKSFDLVRKNAQEQEDIKQTVIGRSKVQNVIIKKAEKINRLEKEQVENGEKNIDLQTKKNKDFADFIADQENSNRLLQASIDGNSKQVQLQLDINRAVAIHGEEHRKLITNILTANQALQDQKKEADNIKEKFAEIGKEIRQGIVENLREAIKGSQSFGDALSNVLDRIADKILDSGLNDLIDNAVSAVKGEKPKKKVGGALGSIAGSFLGPIGTVAGGFLGGLLPFANGGRPPVGKAALVGERGPEIFVPKVAGTIIPNNKLGGGDNTTNIVNVSVDASNSSVSGSNADAQQLGAVIGAAVQAQLIKEKRSGGLLAR